MNFYNCLKYNSVFFFFTLSSMHEETRFLNQSSGEIPEVYVLNFKKNIKYLKKANMYDSLKEENHLYMTLLTCGINTLFKNSDNVEKTLVKDISTIAELRNNKIVAHRLDHLKKANEQLDMLQETSQQLRDSNYLMLQLVVLAPLLYRATFHSLEN